MVILPPISYYFEWYNQEFYIVYFRCLFSEAVFFLKLNDYIISVIAIINYLIIFSNLLLMGRK